MLDAFTAFFFRHCFVIALVAAHFTTFLFGVLCDAYGVMLCKKISFHDDLVGRPPRKGGLNR
jgi:hypothetical protein